LFFLPGISATPAGVDMAGSGIAGLDATQKPPRGSLPAYAAIALTGVLPIFFRFMRQT